MSISIYTYARYLNQLNLIDVSGTPSEPEKNVQQRQDVQLTKSCSSSSSDGS